MFVIIDGRFSGFFKMSGLTPFQQLKLSVSESETVDAGIQDRHLAPCSQWNVLGNTICCFDDAEVCDDGQFFTGMSRRDIENGVRRTVMELPRAFRFSFSVRKEKIRIGSVPCFIQIRVSRLDFIRHHSFTNAIAAFAECLVCMNSQLMVAGDFIRRLPCPLQIT